jgi:predicted DNA-binding transcriptional regulator AlpA
MSVHQASKSPTSQPAGFFDEPLVVVPEAPRKRRASEEAAATNRGALAEMGLLTVEQVAEFVQLSPRAIWRLRSKGWIPDPIRVGSAVRWRRSEIVAWVEAGCPKE